MSVSEGRPFLNRQDNNDDKDDEDSETATASLELSFEKQKLHNKPISIIVYDAKQCL